ncbi:exocyst complex component 3-like protein isoform X2 [Polypterus senegalus]|uniref:exocyst complex component 3-like protein isoform X2 n=1 Tax=Polypterus senegalus TaxID=55291 RepID=UPI001965CDAE|nr:exocyst complex component 3-like protein isoform X2 [Polypterus senegalus]
MFELAKCIHNSHTMSKKKNIRKMFFKNIKKRLNPSKTGNNKNRIDEMDPLLKKDDPPNPNYMGINEAPQIGQMLQNGQLSEAYPLICALDRSHRKTHFEVMQKQWTRLITEVFSGYTADPKKLHSALQVIQMGKSYDSCLEDHLEGEELMPHKWWAECTKLIEKLVMTGVPQLSSDRQGSGVNGYLQTVQEYMLQELLRLTPLLQGTWVLQLYAHYLHKSIFEQLNKALERAMLISDCFILLFWTMRTYKSEHLLGHQKLYQYKDLDLDMVLFTSWFTKAQDKLLQCIKLEVSETLEKILKNEYSAEATPDEEKFIQFQLDIKLFLNGLIKEAQKISQEMKKCVQVACARELLLFAEKYQPLHNKYMNTYIRASSREIYLMKAINNLINLRLYLGTLIDDPEDSNFRRVESSLKRTEEQAVNILLSEEVFKSQTRFKKYFKGKGRPLNEMAEEIVGRLGRLQMQNHDAYKVVVTSAYERICSEYLMGLLATITNYRCLLKLWNNNEQRMKHDAECLLRSFSSLDAGLRNNNQMLVQVAELLQLKEVSNIMLAATAMMQKFPQLSEKILKDILALKQLSKSQIASILEVVKENNHHLVKNNEGIRLPVCLARLLSCFCCCFRKKKKTVGPALDSQLNPHV